MKIIIENIGVFKYAEFTLADLTIICGKNNSGKTYATYALYGFLDYFHNVYPVKIPVIDIEDLIVKGSIRINFDNSLSSLSRYIEEACKGYLSYLPEVFGTCEACFPKSSFRVKLEESDINIIGEVKSSYKIGDTTLLEICKTKNDNHLTIRFLSKSIEKDEVVQLITTLQKILGETIKELLFGHIFPQCFIASSERTGIALFNSEFNIEKESQFERDIDASLGVNEFNNEDLPDNFCKFSYSLPVQRDIAFFRNLESISKEQSDLSKSHPDVLEQIALIAEGKYEVSSNRLWFVPTRRKSLKFKIKECGQAVRSLIDVCFYLKHMARPGQLLIIEKPEMGLHPEGQRKFARLISLLVNYGLRILITTHSDYILKELNTLIMLKSRLGKPHIASVMEKFRYSEDELLDVNKLKVFVSCMSSLKLKNNSRRSRLQTLVEAHREPIYGVSTNNFDEAIEEMNHIQDQIIFGGNGKSI